MHLFINKHAQPRILSNLTQKLTKITIIVSQGQPQRPRDYQSSRSSKQEAVKYGDVFSVSGDLAPKPIAPQDAAAMQAAENMVLGETQKGGPAAVMQSAASVNDRVGAVGHREATDIARNEGVTVRETQVGGTRVITEEVGGQVLGRYVAPDAPLRSPGNVLNRDSITIGEALEATALSCGDKPVDQGDAAAIQAAEMRDTGTNEITPGGVASMAQSAADVNPRIMRDENKTTLCEVLADATARLPVDKAVTRADAEGVIGAEVRNKLDMSTTLGGVAASIAATTTTTKLTFFNGQNS